ncbi:MAG TPA: PhzF family phenazine biosynthesis protein [Rhizomicrobium sp.]
MKLKMWQVDAFAAKPLGGNPAAVVPLEGWLDAALMQAIAAENNVAETAFFVKTGAGAYDLRWFAPSREVDLCGHATLASAWILFNKTDTALDEVRFMTRSGELVVTRGDGGNAMSLPSAESEPFTPPPGFADALGKALNAPAPKELHIAAKGGAGARALIAVWETPDQVKALNPAADLKDVLMRIQCGSLLVTAAGGDPTAEGGKDNNPYDMVSRFFAPYYGVPEDPVTGSAHAALTPFWSKRLGKTVLKARQASARGGDLLCTYAGERTVIQGDCALYLEGEIEV